VKRAVVNQDKNYLKVTQRLIAEMISAIASGVVFGQMYFLSDV
jgi:hypothetical protein